MFGNDPGNTVQRWPSYGTLSNYVASTQIIYIDVTASGASQPLASASNAIERFKDAAARYRAGAALRTRRALVARRRTLLRKRAGASPAGPDRGFSRGRACSLSEAWRVRGPP